MEPKPLWSKPNSQKLGKVFGRWKVSKQGSKSTVQLYQNGLIEIQSSSKGIEFDFDLKFTFSKDNIEINFERGSQNCAYQLNSLVELEAWRQILRNKVNQRGFHQQFKPLKKIGKGNFASVYLAQKTEDGQHYAVKAFSKQAAYSEENGKQCLVKEIEIARTLSHKNTMKLYQVFESENSLYFIFQLLSGGQLYDKVKAKYKFKSHQIRSIIFGILKGLKQMHSKNIMHRDLKPQNLLFRKENEWDCVIADYGLAEFCDIESYLFVRCGTPGYVAPEVINIKDMSTKYKAICDIYSLGLIFHVLLFGKSAFNGKTYNQVLTQNRAANIDFSEEEYKKVTPETLDLLTHMLKKKPYERISAQQALQHSYFKGMQEEYEQQSSPLPKTIVEHFSQHSSNSTSNSNSKDYPSCDSPLLTTANPKRRFDKSLKKDSCVQFHMGKENVFTGKTQEVQALKSNKISINNAMTPLRKPKISQFNAQHK